MILPSKFTHRLNRQKKVLQPFLPHPPAMSSYRGMDLLKHPPSLSTAKNFLRSIQQFPAT